MPASPDDLAALIVRTIKRALEPLAARLLAVEAGQAAIGPILERLAGAEARLELADRVARDQATAIAQATARQAALEARPLEPLGPVREVLAGVEARQAALLADVATLRGELAAAATTRTDQAIALEAASARVAALEARPAPDALGPVREALAALEARVATLAPVGEALAQLRERVAALDARPLVPGPPGPAGADGLGFDDVTVDFDQAHTATIRFVAGERVKAFPLALPFLRYRGVYREGTPYERGDVVTWGGSMHTCEAATTSKPGLVASAAAWTLCVKAGSPGRDGKDGARGPAGPAGKDWQQVYDASRAR